MPALDHDGNLVAETFDGGPRAGKSEATREGQAGVLVLDEADEIGVRWLTRPTIEDRRVVGKQPPDVGLQRPPVVLDRMQREGERQRMRGG